MTLESPDTYGEAFFSLQVEANEAFEDILEEGVAPFIPSIFSDAGVRAAMPFDILPKLEALFEFPNAGLSAIGGRFVSEIADQSVSMVLSPPLREVQYAANKAFPNLRLTPEQAMNLKRRKRIVDIDYKWALEAVGYNEPRGQQVFDAGNPFPTIPELFRWARYHGSPDNVWATLFPYVWLDAQDYPKWDWLTQSQLGLDQITRKYRRGDSDVDSTVTALMQLGWSRDKTPDLIDQSYLIPNAMLLLQADLLNDISGEQITIDLTAGDIHPKYHQHYMDAVLTKPNTQDLLAYHLRQENDLRGLGDDLQRIGIHPKYLEVYETLAHQIPPVSDIITMAVREAFSPATAARFGQYEDFPKEFARYAAQQGLSEEWSKRYWAAHWALPSLTQGFDMFHRGIIDRDDLTLLMKAQDTMPFWRDKLIQMAYKPLTRVDVRRMYKEGILDEKGVYKAYQDVGYSDENAEAMTEFTVKQTLNALAKFSTADVVRAYAQRMIDNSEAKSILGALGIKGSAISYIISMADYKKEWARAEQRIKAIRNLYRKGEYKDNEARSQLLKLDMPTAQVDDLMEQWWFDKEADGVATWSKAETLKFLKTGAITKVRATTELESMGYDQEHIRLYLETAPSTSKQN